MVNDRRRAVALLYGGQGCEREVSRRSRDHLLPLLDGVKYNIRQVFIDRAGGWLCEEGEVFPYQRGLLCPKKNEKYPVDCAIPLLHGDYGEDGRIQGALDCAGIPYIGCSAAAGAICRDKALVKMISARLGIPTLPFILLLRSEGMDYALRSAEERVGYPLFLKPASLGSSIGAARADSRDMLKEALSVAFGMTDRVVIEPFLDDRRELECGYFSTKCKEIFTNPGEILHNGVYGYDEKYISRRVRLSLRADIPSDIREQVREYSRRLVRTLGVRDIARIDFFLSGGRLYFNEINTMPGFTDGSLYARMMEAEGIGEGELFSRLIESRLSEG